MHDKKALSLFKRLRNISLVFESSHATQKHFTACYHKYSLIAIYPSPSRCNNLTHLWSKFLNIKVKIKQLLLSNIINPRAN